MVRGFQAAIIESASKVCCAKWHKLDSPAYVRLCGVLILWESNCCSYGPHPPTFMKGGGASSAPTRNLTQTAAGFVSGIPAFRGPQMGPGSFLLGSFVQDGNVRAVSRCKALLQER